MTDHRLDSAGPHLATDTPGGNLWRGFTVEQALKDLHQLITALTDTLTPPLTCFSNGEIA